MVVPHLGYRLLDPLSRIRAKTYSIVFNGFLFEILATERQDRRRCVSKEDADAARIHLSSGPDRRCGSWYAEAGDESIALLDEYHDTVIEARLKFFRVVAADLLALKKRSDAQGTMEGTAALITDASVIREADDIKLRGIMKDPFAGRALIVLYTDYRSSIGITVKL